MQGLQVIILGCLAAAAYARKSNITSTTPASAEEDKPNTRIFGLLSGLAALGGVKPPFGGTGGINTGLGGIGGINPGIGGGFNPGIGISQTCRYWCRTPQGQAYCCEGNNQPQGPVGVKPGFCPPVRPQCPPVRSFAPPLTCSNDYACGGVDKCCFDTCLQEHVCKPPIGTGGFDVLGSFPGGIGR